MTQPNKRIRRLYRERVDLPSLETIRELFHFDSESSCLYWKVRRQNGAMAGDLAGCIDSNGYRIIRINGFGYKAHRLIWKYVYGVDPSRQIDHVNGCKSDNSIANLREVSVSVNCQNQHSATARNSIGLLGVSLRKDGRYSARITTNGKTKTLGYFKNSIDAHNAYLMAKRREHEGCAI